MTHYGWPALFVIFVWWASTAAIIALNHLPPRTFRWSLFWASIGAVGAGGAVLATRDSVSFLSLYVSFAAGLGLWGWTQLTFYMGAITGPRRVACPHTCSGWTHFGHAVETCIHHELVAAALGLALLGFTWQSANMTAFWTYFVLWALHLSAKLNVVLGVRNLNAQFFPPHLAYLTSFLRVRPVNALFPFSVTAGTIACVLLAQAAFSPAASSHDAIVLTMLLVLAVLGVIEHWFLILPLPAEKLWTWVLRRDNPHGDYVSRARHSAGLTPGYVE